MVWKLISYSEIRVPMDRYGRHHCIGIVEDDKGVRRPVWIDIKYSNMLKHGLEGEVVEKWTPYGMVNVFIPKVGVVEEKTVIIVGVWNDLGRALVLEGLRQGYEIVGLDGEVEPPRDLVEALKDFGRGFSYYKVDLSSEEELRQVLMKASEGRRIVGIVNSMPYWTISVGSLDRLEVLRRFFEERIVKSYVICEVSAKILSKFGGGIIINIVSLPSIAGLGRFLEASIVESAIIGLTRSIASRYLREKVRCNAIVHGMFEVEVKDKFKLRDVRELYFKTPTRSFVRVEEVARTAIHLLDEELEHATGMVVVVGGGVTEVL